MFVQKGDGRRERFPQVTQVYTVGRWMIISGVRIRSGPWRHCSRKLSIVVHPSFRNRSKGALGNRLQRSLLVVQPSSCSRVPNSSS